MEFASAKSAWSVFERFKPREIERERDRSKQELEPDGACPPYDAYLIKTSYVSHIQPLTHTHTLAES